MKKVLIFLMLLFVVVLLVSCGQKNVKKDSSVDDIEDSNEEINDAETNVADDKDTADVEDKVEETKGKVSGIEGLSQKNLDELKGDFEAMKFEDINGLS